MEEENTPEVQFEQDENEENTLQIVDSDLVIENSVTENVPSENQDVEMEIVSDSEEPLEPPVPVAVNFEEAPVEEVPGEQEAVLVEEEEEEVPAEAIEKSHEQRESFMEMFRIAPRIRDILPDLRVFMSHPDVLDEDRKEVEALVEAKIQDEKAKKKAEKVSKKEKEVEKPPVSLEEAVKTVTGIDLAAILQKIPKNPQQIAPVTIPPPVVMPPPIVIPGMPNAPAVTEVLNLVSLPLNAKPVPIPIASSVIAPNYATAPPIALTDPNVASIGHGKAGFSTPHPNEIPIELRHSKPDMIAPIPDELRNLGAVPVVTSIPTIPNEFLPPEQRILGSLPLTFVRPPMRKSLFLSGARSGKRCDRIKMQRKKDKKEVKLEKKLEKKSEDSLESVEKRPRGGHRGRAGAGRSSFEATGMNALPQGLNKNSPLAVKRYHARQLAKETGMTLEEAMEEIEEQCNAFGGEDTPEAIEHDTKLMEMIKKRGDEHWNQRHNYTPVDHSKGIPGVDRPPGGNRDRGEKVRSKSPVTGVDRPPGGDRIERSRDREPGGGVPGVDRAPGRGSRGIDRPPGGDSRGVDRPPGGGGIPGVDRPPGGGRRGVDRPPGSGMPGIDRPPGGDRMGDKQRRGARGGVKERERKRRRDEFQRGGGGGGRGGGRDGGRDYGGPPQKSGRRDRYDDYDRSYQGTSGYGQDYDSQTYGERGYDGHYQGQEDYYGSQEGYGEYNQQHYGEGYDQQGYGQNGDSYYGHEGQDASTYYQEDGSQYYNQYYGTAPAEGEASAVTGTDYHATFSVPPPPAPPPS